MKLSICTDVFGKIPLTEMLDKVVAYGLDAVELNMAFEDKFGVSIADEDLVNLKTVGDIFDYLAARAA